jgi:hypothetical protein
MYKINRKIVLLFILLATIFWMYKCCTPKKEYFVFKVRGADGVEVLLDQQDFASVINGLKPKSVKGTFTTDDLSELVRELKGLWVAQMTTSFKRRGCSTNKRGDPECVNMLNILSLIHEANTVNYSGKTITSKEEWLNSIIDAAFTMFPSTKPSTYQPSDDDIIRKVKNNTSIKDM